MATPSNRSLRTRFRETLSRSRSKTPTRDANLVPIRPSAESTGPIPQDPVSRSGDPTVGVPPLSTDTIPHILVSASTQLTPAVEPSALSNATAPSSTALAAGDTATVSRAISLDEERSLLWGKAYKEVHHEKTKLLEAYEIILADVSSGASTTNVSSLPATNNRQELLQSIASAQKERMENRQWTWGLFGSQKTLRETADTIFQLVQKSSALIAVGMTFAPPFVSIPWSAVSALIPLIMNNSTEQHAAIDGLRSITEIMFAYRIAEVTFLSDPNLINDFCRAVLPLYKQIIEYQAASTVYFGRDTLSRLGRDMLAGTRWVDALTAVKKCEADNKSATGFLGALQNKTALKRLLDILSEQSLQISQLSRDVESRNNELTQITLWASEVPYYKDHYQVRTGISTFGKQWILKDHDYEHWRASECGVLFLEGTVGKGKTSLISEVIEDVLRHSNSKIAYFYSSRTNTTGIATDGNNSRHDPMIVIRSIMSQLSLSSDGLAIASPLVNRYRSNPHKVPGGCTMQSHECLELLQEMFRDDSVGLWTIVVDALDECMNPEELISSLKSMTSINSKTRLLVSSREGNLGFVKANYFPALNALRIDNQNYQNIEDYVESEIKARRKGTQIGDAQAMELQKVLIQGAEGMFRWVVLQLDLFFPRKAFPRPRLQSYYNLRIEKLKASRLDSEGRLRETYREIFANSTGNGEDARQYSVICTALKWILCSFRSLTAKELAYACSGRSDGTVPDDLTEDFILVNCANLLVKTEYDDVRLAHLSVGEFLETEFPNEFSQGNAHNQIAVLCCDLYGGPRDSVASTAQISDPGDTLLDQKSLTRADNDLRDWFRHYASRYWPAHCRKAAVDDVLEKLMPQTSNMTSPHEAVRAKRYEILSAMIARKANLEFRDMDGYSALHEAVRIQDERALKSLIHNGALLDAEDVRGDLPLHTAATLYSTGIIEILIRNGADINKNNRDGVTPVQMATYRGRENNVRVLMRFGARRSCMDSRMNSPLHFACSAGLVTVIRTLISAGCNIESVNADGDTPLHVAASYGEMLALITLLENGANRGITNTAGRTPLKEALEHGENDSALWLHDYGIQSEKKSFRSEVFSSIKIVSNSICRLCDVGKWLSRPRKGVRHGHYKSLADLIRSANQGCDMCQLFVQGLVPNPEDVQNSWNDNEVSVEAILTIDHGRAFALDKEILKVSLGSVAEFSLEMCVDDNSDLTAMISGTVLQNDSGSIKSFSLLKSWRAHCEMEHVQCKSNRNLGDSYALPRRLVDISTDENAPDRLRLVDGQSLPASATVYGFFSHRYGRHYVPASNTKMLRDGNISFHEIEKSIQDSIRIFRYFGIRYLWVDKLCIRVGEAEEMVSETAKLAQYAKNAALVINGGDHQDEHGLFDVRTNSNNLLRLSCEWVQVSTNVTKVDSLCFRAPLRSAEECFCDDMLVRAWMFQELSLPRNVILYGRDRVYWKCWGMMCAEGSFWRPLPVLAFGGYATPMRLFGHKVVFNGWYAMLELFSTKELTLFDDKLPAVQGMAEALWQSWREESYAWGHWVEDLHQGLLWYARAVRESSRPSQFAPSWSWASLQGPVSFSILHGMRLVGSADSPPDAGWRALRPGTYLSSALESPVARANLLSDPPSISIAGEHRNVLVIKNAQWRHLSLNDENQTLQLLFDTWEDETEWRAGSKLIGVLINKWRPDTTDEGLRWIGLVLTVNQYEDGYRRVGLLLGPRVGDDVSAWSVGFHGLVV